MGRKRLALVLSALLGLPAVAGAQPTVRADDLARLDQLDAAAGRALTQLLSTGSDDDIAAARRALGGAAQPLDEAGARALAGDWDCAMTKLGGNLAAIAYPPFRCQIELRDGVLHFDKLTGSQRTSGTIQRLGDRWVYLGSTFVQGEAPRRYDEFPAKIDTTAGETLPDVGVLQVTGAGRARLVQPLPFRESILNVLTLSR